MKKLLMTALCAVFAGYAEAQDSAPAPEAVTQEKCAIDEKDVDAMMDEYIASKGWHEGLNVKNGKAFFVAKGTGVIQAPLNHPKYIDSRVNAFNKAMLEAKKAMVEYMKVMIGSVTLKEYGEGAAVSPEPTEEQKLEDKLQQLLYAKINKDLAAQGIDPIKDPVQAKKELGKMLNSEVYLKIVASAAEAMVVGMQACCTFEGTPKSGKGEIGVVAIHSDKLQRMAFSLATGVPVPRVAGKSPIAAQVSSDPSVLMSSFGVQQRIDENGDLVLVGFGQAGGVSESKMSARGAKSCARQNAMAAIREFAGEQVAVATVAVEAESAEEFASGAEVYMNESAFAERIAAVADAMNIEGIAPLRNMSAKHPLNGRTVYVCAVTWSPKQAMMARRLKQSGANPVAPNAQNGSAGGAASPSTGGKAFNNQGDSADEDAF